MGSSFFSNPTDYEVVQEGGEGSSFYDGPAYTEIDPVAVTALATQAAASASAAAGSATSSASSAAAALVSETNAAASATAADASDDNAVAQAAIATTKASEAATSAAAALVSEGNASTSASAASTSAAAALVSEGNADTSEANAASSASAAATSASNAATSETNAAAAVQAAAGTATPLVDGAAAVGAGVKWAREDHIHPTDTSRADAAATTAALALKAATTYVDAQDALKAPLASPALTGTPTAPTASASDDSTTIATTAHVKANFGAWTDYTPSVSALSGSFTSVSATGRYRQVGKTVFFNLKVTITTNGTAASGVSTTLPVACKSVFVFFGREDAVTGAVFQAKSTAASTTVNMFTFSNLYPGGDGYQLVISGSYEAN